MLKKNVFDSIIGQLKHGSPEDPDAEWKAAIALREAKSPRQKREAVEALIESLTEGRAHALIRAHAAESLGYLGDQRAVPFLRQALKDSYRLVRAYAAGALAILGDPRAARPLIASLQNDAFFGVRAEAAKALAALLLLLPKTTRQRIRRTLDLQRARELKHPRPGSERVVAEIDNALKQIR
jgi:HEAT repeat protein